MAKEIITLSGRPVYVNVHRLMIEGGPVRIAEASRECWFAATGVYIGRAAGGPIRPAIVDLILDRLRGGD